MSRYDELDRWDQADRDHFNTYGYPDTPEVAAEQEWRDELEAFEKQSRYYDAPLPEPKRVSDDWLEEEAA